MTGYTITITRRDQPDGARTTIHFDTAAGGTRVTELTVQAAGGAGLSPQELPAIDLAGLVAALAPRSAATAAELTSGGSSPDSAIAPASTSTGRRRPTRRADTPARAAAKTVATGKAGTRRRSAADKQATAAKTSRAYRRMPDQREFVAVFRKAGSVNAVAEHFAVPPHTVSGWLRRLRALGVLPRT